MKTRPSAFTFTQFAAICGLFVLLSAMFPAPAKAALLRGRLERVDQYGNHYPAPGITVTVYNANLGRSAPVVTDGAGMYYLNIPAGGYVLEIWVSNPPRVYQITVFEPNTDIPPIIV